MTRKVEAHLVADFARKNRHLSCREVGNEFGITRQRAHQIAVEYGVVTPSQRKQINLGDILNLYYGEHLSLVEVARRLGCNYETLYRHLLKAGYTERHYATGNRPYRRSGHGA